MKLSHICRILNQSSQDLEDRDITGVSIDSRTVKPGHVFLCIKGTQVDGHLFAAQALERGAALIVASNPLPQVPKAKVIYVEDTRDAAGVVAAALQDYPTKKMALIGVTGTNGKTTTTYMLRSILQFAGHPTALLGTTGWLFNDARHALPVTTPDALTLQRLFATFVTKGAKYCVMEVSSHAADQKRIAGSRFRAGVLTNITDREHLDYHGNFQAYREAKGAFFKHWIASDEGAFAVINLDDPSAEWFLRRSGQPCVTYSRDPRKAATISALNCTSNIFGARFTLRINADEYPVVLPLPGLYNIENALAAAGTTLQLGISADMVVKGMQAMDAVPGRFQRINHPGNFAVIVDYAHTEDALKNVLTAARGCNPRRLICVFGCGGDRDQSKRPRMGAVATSLADITIVTSDNPRNEEPHKIIDQIMQGVSRQSAVEVILERAQAIERAIATAQAGDMIIIAGKGHEDYQIFADETIHFDDREHAERALRKHHPW